jgi:hypothetical protein
MQNDTVWKWGAGILIFAIIYYAVPGNVKLPLLVLVLLAGILIELRNPSISNDWQIGTSNNDTGSLRNNLSAINKGVLGTSAP